MMMIPRLVTLVGMVMDVSADAKLKARVPNDSYDDDI